jgi:hypothetical protein
MALAAMRVTHVDGQGPARAMAVGFKGNQLWEYR